MDSSFRYLNLPKGTVSIFNNGNSLIAVVKHRYVLKNWNTGSFKWEDSCSIFPEVIKVLNNLPDNPDDCKFIESDDD